MKESWYGGQFFFNEKSKDLDFVYLSSPCPSLKVSNVHRFVCTRSKIYGKHTVGTRLLVGSLGVKFRIQKGVPTYKRDQVSVENALYK